MAGRKAAVVGNNPGVTKNLSWLKTKSNILLLDSPGILWPKLASEEVALNLASMSAIPRDILPVDRVAVHILNKLNDFYPLFLKQRYNIEKMDNDELENIYDIIGRKMGAIVSGGEIDYDRVSRTILEDIKNERIKGVTFWGKITAAATTGPTKGPLPTSSVPAINLKPFSYNSFSYFSKSFLVIIKILGLFFNNSSISFILEE